MIVRYWRTITLASGADRYHEYLDKNLIPKYRAVDGLEGLFVLREVRGGLAHFLLISLWKSHQAILNVMAPKAGDAHQPASVNHSYLAFETRAKNYEVLNMMARIK